MLRPPGIKSVSATSSSAAFKKSRSKFALERFFDFVFVYNNLLEGVSPGLFRLLGYDDLDIVFATGYLLTRRVTRVFGYFSMVWMKLWSSE
jgi:hypothetical protein